MSPAPMLLMVALASAPQAAGDRPAPHDEYFLSETSTKTAEGKVLGLACGLTRRQYRPSERTITESGIAMTPEPDALPTVLTLVWDVDGGTAKVSERNGRASGKGTLVGPAWDWTEWTWIGRIRDVPGTFRNTARRTRRGVAIRTERLDADGKAVEVYDQVDTRISKETYDLLRSKLLPE